MYRFRPITAVRYIGGTLHIHFQEKDAGREDFTSQLYLPEHPENEGDFSYMRLVSERNRIASSFLQVPDPELE